jgi:serine/threonine protein kinase
LIAALYYSAPECLTSDAPITTKADIWSAGAILYYLTYGTKPIYWNSKSPPGVPPTRSTLVQDVLHHCLQRNINQRADHHWLAQHPLTTGSAIV